MEEYAKLVVLAVLVVPVVFVNIDIGALMPDVRAQAYGSVGDPFESGSMLFVGDIMLAREVDRIMQREGADYPFRGTRALLHSVDHVVGNFEASVPQEHVETPAYAYNFSVRPEVFAALSDVSFATLSLANNHSLDFGKSGFANTLDVCRRHTPVCIGAQRYGAHEPYRELSLGSSRVALIAVNTVGTDLDRTALESDVRELSERSDQVIVYVHWGEEYVPTHTEDQEALAHLVIDAGADAVIGHHPHVVQDIAMYNGAPIFYSLGNFVFDQYFDEDVQTGLALRVDFEKTFVRYTLIPLTSTASASQPQVLRVDARDAFVRELSSRSDRAYEHQFTVPY